MPGQTEPAETCRYGSSENKAGEKKEDSDEFSTRSDGNEWYLAPNFKTEDLDNLNIRLALSKSFNKEAITKSILKDGSAITNGVVPAGLAASTSGVDSLTYELICDDPESCQKIAQFLQSEWQTNLPGLTC